MAIDEYTKTPWVNDSAPSIDATNLLNIENGIGDVTTAVIALENAPGYTLPAATDTVLGGLKFSVTTDGGTGIVTGSIYVT